MFKRTSAQSVANEDGVEITPAGRCGLLYRQGFHSIRFLVADGFDNDGAYVINIYWELPLRWGHGPELSGPETDAVRRLLIEGHAVLGIRLYFREGVRDPS